MRLWHCAASQRLSVVSIEMRGDCLLPGMAAKILETRLQPPQAVTFVVINGLNV